MNSSSLDQFVAHVHEAVNSSPDAIASHFRRSKKQLSQSGPPVVCRAAATVDPVSQPTGHGCILYAATHSDTLVAACVQNFTCLLVSAGAWYATVPP